MRLVVPITWPRTRLLFREFDDAGGDFVFARTGQGVRVTSAMGESVHVLWENVVDFAGSKPVEFPRIERWDPARHVPVVAGWIRARGMGTDAGDTSLLPSTGFVVDGIVAGFLYRTDAALAFIDSFVGDPNAGRDARGAALDVLISALQAEARRLGYTAIAGTPSIPSVIERFRTNGYRLIDGCSYAIRRM